jgi:hypothetical protein
VYETRGKRSLRSLPSFLKQQSSYPADRDRQADLSLDPPTKTDVGLNRCSTTRQEWRTAPSPGVEVDHSNRNSKIQTLGEGLAEAQFSSNKTVHSRHYSAPSLLYVLLLYYPRLADTSLRGSISLPREIGIERTNYNLLVVSDKQVRHSTFCACLIATQVLVRHQATPPKKGEKETNDAGEHDPYNEDGYKAVSDSSSYNPRKLQPSSSFSYHHLANKATPSPPPPQPPPSDRSSSRNLPRPHCLSFVACIQRSFRIPHATKLFWCLYPSVTSPSS